MNTKSCWTLNPIHFGEPIVLQVGVTTVGRKPSCGIVVDKTHYPSRLHCQFEVGCKDDNQIQIRDLGSTNGIFINGEKRNGVIEIKEGDRIGIGCEATDEKVKEENMPVFVLSTESTPYSTPQLIENMEALVIDLVDDDEMETDLCEPKAEDSSIKDKTKDSLCNDQTKTKVLLGNSSLVDTKEILFPTNSTGLKTVKQETPERDPGGGSTSVKTEIENPDEVYEISDEEDVAMELSQCLWRDIKKEFMDLDVDSCDGSAEENEDIVAEKVDSQNDKPVSPLYNIERDAENDDENGDESLSIWVNKLSQSITSERSTPIKKPLKRVNPEIIEAPSLPAKRGKLRGVSAAPQVKTLHRTDNKIESIKARTRQQTLEKDLKAKWLQKPSFSRRNEQEKKKVIKNERIQKLKKIAEKQASARSAAEKDVKVTKRPKVKVTEKNRGAFLVESTDSHKRRSERISDIKKRDSESNTDKDKDFVETNQNCERSVSAKHSTDKVDGEKRKLVQYTEPHTECREVKKMKMDSSKQRNGNSKTIMPSLPALKNFKIPSVKNDDGKKTTDSQTSRKSILKSPFAKEKKQSRRSVRFDDNVSITTFQIDNANAVMRKVDSKDAPIDFSRFITLCAENDRRRRLNLEDHSEKIVSEVLKWDPRWVKEGRESMIGGDLVPMMSNFNNLTDFQRAIFPLMKLELWALIERECKSKESLPSTTLTIASCCVENTHGQRIVLHCEVPAPKNQRKEGLINHGDLCILKFESHSESKELFGLVKMLRKSMANNSPHLNIAFEMHYDEAYKKLADSTRQIKARTITQIRVELGAFNAVYNLKLSPLCDKILSPFQNKCNMKYAIDNIRYKGYDVLNANQQKILLNTYRKSIDETNTNISLIQGPPGTGKSRLIANLVLQIIYGDEVKTLSKKILVCSQSNTAIDVIANKLLTIRSKMTRDKFNLVRFGILERISSEVQCISIQKLIAKSNASKLNSDHKMLIEEKKLIELKITTLRSNEKTNCAVQDEIQALYDRRDLINKLLSKQMPPELERSSYQRFLQGAHVVCTTLSSCIKLLQYVKYFDMCIIDEATQCLEPWTLIPLQFNIRSLVLVGDTQQLPGTLLSQVTGKFGFNVSLFTRIQKCLEIAEKQNISLLRTQYRMHPEICQWPNYYFYKECLTNDKSTSELKCGFKPYNVLSLQYDQSTSSREDIGRGKIINVNEAQFISKLIKSMSEILPTDKYSYGIITPYADHRSVLSKDLENSGVKNVVVNTIDSYQGKEKDVIIISNARTKGVGFLANSQRLNVALTRARKCLILCGNFAALAHVPVWKSLLENARNRGFYYDIGISDVSNFDSKVMCHIKNGVE